MHRAMLAMIKARQALPVVPFHMLAIGSPLFMMCFRDTSAVLPKATRRRELVNPGAELRLELPGAAQGAFHKAIGVRIVGEYFPVRIPFQLALLQLEANPAQLTDGIRAHGD